MIGYLPCIVARLTADYNPSGHHTGIDLGWIDGYEINCPILAWRDGVVVDKGYQADTRGNYLTIRHQQGNVYQYTNYLHLKEASPLNIGDKVECQQQIGIKGTTGGSTGVHLHFAVSVETDNAGCKVQWVADHTLDPKPVTFLKSDVDYILANMDWILPMPVERNEKVHQFEVTATDLNIRKGHGKAYDKTGRFIPCKIYDVVDVYTEPNGYTWHKLATERWIASAWNGDFNGYGIDYPADEKDKKIKELEAKNKALQTKIDSAIAILTDSK